MIESQSERVGDNQLLPGTHKTSVQAGCLSKKQLFFLLRPHARVYNSVVVQAFFTDDLLCSCGITRDQMRRMRVFPAPVHGVLIQHLTESRIL